MKTINLVITTPIKEVYNGQVEIVTLKTANGFIGLQANHAPFFSNIEPGKLEINSEKSKNHEKYLVGSGLIYCNGSEINILTDDILLYDEIDIERAKKDRELALELLKQGNSIGPDMAKVELKLKKAISKIDAYNEIHK
ncbi:ATP synthase F1 subunit epsilon [Mycoplasmopsis anatis]|uniref:ATP synthase epsilon chain n=1 Tax=Mycoplasmopsis anatis TaxID=171279 RepID=A0A9Q3L7U9_9BACT|nr:ATP synthase F1 subunit epsilon [Mycoplasmopsis anatis]MBW0594750.1 ATP synthase F1 subunit epsilon [Mycoplasmopsis anatis]MBW0595444.1 ATP synthase F1 subunit epsilon [Mycoplasmopsis anatis]MBW0597214.1 ATP synthase F1 subunit epsilon [Mycoplasmopsis anatis]MBW0598327.1 ATP synthase F1 subunit epsilon [Mycoplasmopsis anatis]MBW0599089.1 ATP synthase F1 subunit epsilon [Mycoplasmopsis anatis]